MSPGAARREATNRAASTVSAPPSPPGNVSGRLRPASGRAAVARALLGELLGMNPLLRDLVTAGLEKRDLTPPRARLLLTLVDTGPIPMHDLSRRLGVTPRNVTGLVDGLEDDGLVRRRAHDTDRRSIVVGLTTRGTRTCRDLRAGYERLADTLLTGIPARDLSATLDVLGRIRAALDARIERAASSRAAAR